MKFIPGQRVFFGKSYGEVQEVLPGGRYLVRQGWTRFVFELSGDELLPMQRRAGPPSWIDMTPLERSVAYPGRCCDCGHVLPLAQRATALRCDEHDAAYRFATEAA